MGELAISTSAGKLRLHVPDVAEGPDPDPGDPSSVLQASDFTYLGSYLLSRTIAEGITFGSPLGLRYVGGQPRFLISAYNNGDNDVAEFALPEGDFGQTITSATRIWLGADVWQASPPAGSHYGWWWEDLGGDAGRLWTNQGIDYAGSGTGVAGLTSAISVRTLNDDGTVSDWNGVWGFEGVSQRCIYGKMIPTPQWFQDAYGLDPYLFGFGGYTSLAANSGTASAGLFIVSGPDPLNYTPPTGYPAEGYVDDSGDDWSIPSSDFKILADHRSGWSADWYDEYTGPGYIPPNDRGHRLTAVTNYYDFGGSTFQGTGSATFTNGSTTVTFSEPQTIADGTWIGPQPEPALAGLPGQVVDGAIAASTTLTLDAPFSGATTTVTSGNWTCSISPPGPPIESAGWISPAPDGINRWAWDSYFGTGVVISGENKQGLVCTGSFASGRAWYHTPGNYLGSDSSAGEIHVFDLHDLGAVANGDKDPWNVQPASMLDITTTAHENGILTASRNNETNAITGGVYDPVAKRYWLLGISVDSGNDCCLMCFDVDDS